MEVVFHPVLANPIPALNIFKNSIPTIKRKEICCKNRSNKASLNLGGKNTIMNHMQCRVNISPIISTYRRNSYTPFSLTKVYDEAHVNN